MTPKVPTRESGTATLGMMVAEIVRKNKKMTSTTSPMVSINSNSTSRTEARMVVVRSVKMVNVHRRRQGRLELRQTLMMRSTTWMMLAPGLALDIDDDGRRVVHPGGLLGVLGPIHRLGHVREHDGRAIAIGDDQFVVVGAGGQLVVGVNLIGDLRPVEVALGLVDAGLLEGGAQVLQVHPISGERRWDWPARARRVFGRRRW